MIAIAAIAKYFLAGVWLAHGLACKLLGAVPRHRMIVARVVGERWASPVTYAVGAVEVVIGLWILSGVQAPLCALTQTVLLVVMNVFELMRARDLLLAPLAMAVANTIFLTLAWWAAVRNH